MLITNDTLKQSLELAMLIILPKKINKTVSDLPQKKKILAIHLSIKLKRPLSYPFIQIKMINKVLPVKLKPLLSKNEN